MIKTEVYIDDLPKTNRMLAFDEINKSWKIISDFYYQTIFKHCLDFIGMLNERA